MNKTDSLIRAQHLVKTFPAKGNSKNGANIIHAISDVSFDIKQGETLALVGESGCGKSTLGRMLIRLLEPTSGFVEYEGNNLMTMPAGVFKHLRRQMQIIFQDPYASLDPRMSVYDIISEPLVTYSLTSGKKETKEYVKQLMNEVGILPEFIDRYPHQFSGGQRQRIGIARAIALKPKFIVCDEPVSALDVSIQSQVLNLLKDIQDKYELTYLFISHDLSVVRFMADRVCVMFLGKICEIATADDLYNSPMHPYTGFLLEAIPLADPKLRGVKKRLLSGELPSPVNPPSGCRFRTRCPFAKDVCAKQVPELRDINGHQVACHFPTIS